MRLLGALLAGVLLAAAIGPGCAPKKLAPPPPEGELYRFPAPRPGEQPVSENATLQTAWREVTSGDTVAAAKRYDKLLRGHAQSSAAWTGLGYARLRAGQLDAASQALGKTSMPGPACKARSASALEEVVGREGAFVMAAVYSLLRPCRQHPATGSHSPCASFTASISGSISGGGASGAGPTGSAVSGMPCMASMLLRTLQDSAVRL